MAEVIQHKRGDSLSLSVVLTEDDGVTPIDITGWSIRSQIRQNRYLVADLTYTAVDESLGQYTLTANDTEDWPTVKCAIDIEYTDLGASIRSSETFNIKVIEDITYD